MKTNAKEKLPIREAYLAIGKQCILCKSSIEHQNVFNGYKYKIDSSIFEVYFCRKCCLGVTIPFPDKEHLDRLYSAETYRDHRARFISPVEKVIRFFRRSRCKKIGKIIQRGRILDIGCAGGTFLSMMRDDGWESYGLELNDETAFYAREGLGLDMRTCELEDAQFQDESFDVITIWHVLEHIPNPVVTIKECSRILKSGGLLVIALPNFGSLQAKIAGKNWFHLDVPYHLYHFTLESLTALLEKSSFRIVKVKHTSLEFSPFGYLQSFLNMVHIENNLLYNILKTKTIRKSLISNKQRFKFYYDLMLTIVLTPLLLPLSLIFSVIESLLGRGGSIEVYALKTGTRV